MPAAPPDSPPKSPWWHRDNHADRRPVLLARGAIQAALRRWFESQGFIEVGPALLHVDVTRPYSHSSADTQSKYRTTDELALEATLDPLRRMAETLVSAGALTPDEVDGIAEAARDLVAEAATAALAADRPDPATVLTNVRAPDRLTPVDDPGDGDPVTFGEAINQALHDAMAADERIRVFGEDVADCVVEIIRKVKFKKHGGKAGKISFEI